MTQWSIPVPVDIPWKESDGGMKIWQVSDNDAWRFTYLVLQHPGSNKWRTNLADGRDHDRRDQAVREAEMHFTKCINRCLCSRPLESFIREMSTELEEVLGRSAACDLIEDVCHFAKGKASFYVRDLPWRMTSGGNLMTMGGDEYPWPFIFLVQSSEAGWLIEGGRRHASSDAACADAQDIFNVKIETLTVGPLEHRVKEFILRAAHSGPGNCRVAFEEIYFRAGEAHHEPGGGIEL